MPMFRDVGSCARAHCSVVGRAISVSAEIPCVGISQTEKVCLRHSPDTAARFDSRNRT